MLYHQFQMLSSLFLPIKMNLGFYSDIQSLALWIYIFSISALVHTVRSTLTCLALLSNTTYCWHWSSLLFLMVQKCRTRFSLCSNSFKMSAVRQEQSIRTKKVFAHDKALIKGECGTFDLLFRGFDVCEHPGHIHAVSVEVLQEDVSVASGQRAGL